MCGKRREGLVSMIEHNKYFKIIWLFVNSIVYLQWSQGKQKKVFAMECNNGLTV